MTSNETSGWNPVILLSTVSKKFNTDSKLTKVECFSMDMCDFSTHIKDAMKLKIVISFEQIDM